jgi:hypothetical protein
MKQYIGVKIINAKPMNRQEYNDFRGWKLPEDENGADEGYLVEYVDGGQANTEEYEGYVSWSPKDVFERAYRQTEGMTFGMAIEAAKKGCKIARKGWNGKNMFVVYQKGYPEGIPANKNTADAFGMNEGDLFKVRPYLQMRCADGTHQMWLASQSDILEEDWEVVR